MDEYLNKLVFSLEYPFSLLLVVGILSVICLASYLAHALTLSGCLAAFAVGFPSFWGLRFEGFFLLMFFFISAGVLGRLSKKSKTEGIEKKTGARDSAQVFANGFPAALGALGYHLTSNALFLGVFVACLAEANSDTWAGEIGRLSRRGPVSIRTFRPVEKGMSGGITALGILGGFLGAACEAALLGFLLPVKGAWGIASMSCLAGFAGCLLDSFLGATVQVQYFNPKTGMRTENEEDEQGNKLEISRGIRWVDNDMVNFMSNLFSMVLAMALLSF